MNSPRELLEKAAEAVRRDLNHIFGEVSRGKLSPTSSRDLVSYVKLLSDVLDMEATEANALAKASEDELKTLASTLLNETHPKSSPVRATEEK